MVIYDEKIGDRCCGANFEQYGEIFTFKVSFYEVLSFSRLTEAQGNIGSWASYPLHI